MPACQQGFKGVVEHLVNHAKVSTRRWPVLRERLVACPPSGGERFNDFDPAQHIAYLVAEGSMLFGRACLVEQPTVLGQLEGRREQNLRDGLLGRDAVL